MAHVVEVSDQCFDSHFFSCVFRLPLTVAVQTPGMPAAYVDSYARTSGKGSGYQRCRPCKTSEDEPNHSTDAMPTGLDSGTVTTWNTLLKLFDGLSYWLRTSQRADLWTVLLSVQQLHVVGRSLQTSCFCSRQVDRTFCVCLFSFRTRVHRLSYEVHTCWFDFKIDRAGVRSLHWPCFFFDQALSIFPAGPEFCTSQQLV
jgi:hypothetical protein